MNKFRIEKKQVTRYVLELECCGCNVQDNLVIGYDFLNRQQALKFVPVTEWNGWDLSVKEKPICPGCRAKKIRESDRGIK